MWWMIAIHVIGAGVTLGFLTVVSREEKLEAGPLILLAALFWPVFWVAVLSMALFEGIEK